MPRRVFDLTIFAFKQAFYAAKTIYEHAFDIMLASLFVFMCVIVFIVVDLAMRIP